MRRSAFVLIYSIILLSFSCEKSEQLKLSVGEVERSECKSNLKAANLENTPDTLSCINYLYDSSTKQLFITHINAGFNCCPGEISCTAILLGDTLVIEETESTSLCDCNCLYDLTYTIDNVKEIEGCILIKEPYWSGYGSIGFEISFNNEKEGSWCSSRKNYPWGM